MKSNLPSFMDGRIIQLNKIQSGRPLSEYELNKKYGCWKVIDEELIRIRENVECHNRKTRSTFYVNVQCDCGNITWVKLSYLKREPKCCERCRAEKRFGKFRYLGKEMGAWHEYYNNIKRGARKRGLECNINPKYMSELYKMQNGKCAITGIEISQSIGNISLDRKNSKLGYVIGNVWWVDRKINMMKQELSMEEFVNTCRFISDRFSEIPADFGNKINRYNSK